MFSSRLGLRHGLTRLPAEERRPIVSAGEQAHNTAEKVDCLVRTRAGLQ
jgi:hypothetical protein